MALTVGIMSPGDMGGGIGNRLVLNGVRVIAALDDRSERTKMLAAQDGVEDVGSVERLVAEADIVLSVLVPSYSTANAELVAAAMRATGATPVYADLNAIAPSTTQKNAEIIRAAGARFVDGGIVGGPPRGKVNPRIYLSGEHAAEVAVLAGYGLLVPVIGDKIGQASGLKMCYAGLTKGMQALATEVLVTAKLMGLEDVLRKEQSDMKENIPDWLARALPQMPPKAHRWIGEMEEIAQTFEDVGMTPRILQGAADVYRWVATTPIGHETPENRDTSRDIQGVAAELAETLTPAAART